MHRKMLLLRLSVGRGGILELPSFCFFFSQCFCIIIVTNVKTFTLLTHYTLTRIEIESFFTKIFSKSKLKFFKVVMVFCYVD